jgi:hypothetical protein
VVVQSVTPAVILAVQVTVRPNHGSVLWAEGDGINVIALDDDLPASWALVPPDERAVGLQLDMNGMESGEGGIVACDLSQDWVRRLSERGTDDVTLCQVSIEDAVTQRAPDVLSGTLVPWAELRRGALAIEDPLRVVRRPLNAALAAAAVLCVLLAGVFLYRSFRYDRLAAGYEAQLVEDFKREFRGWPVPPNVRRMVESERAKVTGGGGPSTSLPAEAQESALRVLHDTLSKIPADSKMTVEKINIYDRVAQVEGRSKAPEDADVLAAALRGAGFEVPPPQMRQREGVWSFVVRGDKPAKAGAAAAAAGGRE